MLHIKTKPLLGVLLACITFNLAPAATYYVSQSGSGATDGSSSSNAWSVSQFNSSSRMTGGDNVIFSGTITSTVSPAVSGSSDSSRITLDLRNATLNSANPRLAIRSRSNLTVLGGALGSSSNGTLLSFEASLPASNNITIDGFTYTGSQTGVANFLWGNYATNLVVQNCTVDNVRCFFGADSNNNYNVTLRNNYARSSLNTTDQTDVISIGDAKGVTIEGNKLINRAESNANMRHNDVIQCYQKGGSSPGNPSNWIIRYNWIELAVATGSGDDSFLMFEAMGGNPTLQCYGNVFYGSDQGGVGNNGIAIGTSLSGSTYYFYNNTVVRKKGPNGTWRINGPGTLYAKNNIAVASPNQTGLFLEWGMASGGFDYNFFHGFGELIGGTSRNAGPNGSTNMDPKFVNYAGNDFSLAAGSPLRGRADSSIGSQYNQGIAAGATWPGPKLVSRPAGAWDVGAYQSGSTATPTVAPSNAQTQIQVK